MATKAGRPTLVSAALARRIAAKVRSGIRLRDAAEQCGIDGASLFRWLDAGKQGDARYKSFAAIVESAVSEGKKPKQAG